MTASKNDQDSLAIEPRPWVGYVLFALIILSFSSWMVGLVGLVLGFRALESGFFIGELIYFLGLIALCKGYMQKYSTQT